ncbi:MAG TPA: anti-sigma factor [Beijerinckiaceae bacterium]|jgi:anti-sigma-K factor RskA
MSPGDDAEAERDALAGEYVLGLLDAEQAKGIERALASDPDLAARVAFWEARLEPASRLAGQAEPDRDAWDRIAGTLNLPGSARSEGQVIPLRPRKDRNGAPTRLWDSLPFWRGVAALATAAAIVLAAVPAFRSALPGDPAVVAGPRTSFVAVLQARDSATGRDDGPAGWVIGVAADRTVTSIPLGRVEAGQGRSLQLWTLIEPAQGPLSLGLVPGAGETRLAPDRLPAIENGQLFEVTLEPEGGSPIGRPTGRVLFIGRAAPVGSSALPTRTRI